jgi:hypothetical protein
MAEKNKKVNPIVIDDPEKNKKYSLTFTREVIKEMEDDGFVLGDIDKFPVTMIPEMFYYAFLANHRDAITREETDNLLEEIGGVGGLPTGFLTRLGELYAEALKSTVVNPRIKVKF